MSVASVIDSPEALKSLVQRVKKAQEVYSSFSQEQVDTIFKALAIAANRARIPLAKIAVEETGMGIVEDKVIKNHFACEYIYNKHKDTKTCGTISEDKPNGIKILAEPVGVIAGIIPTTNPTSTVIFKSLISLKTRNAVIFSPHPRAKRSTIATAGIMLDAAVKAGAPPDIIGWIDVPSLELTNLLMAHDDVATILATGGSGMVKAAYSSGKPALGVGAGNTPAIIDETADIKMAVSSIFVSKTFDNGMICSSEQSIIIVKDVYDEVIKELKLCGAYILSGQEKEKIAKTIIVKGKLNPAIVGQSACKIADMAGVKVPLDTKVLAGEVSKISLEEEFAQEKLSPVIAIYRAENFEDAVEKAHRLVELCGAGHTSVLYTDERRQNRINAFAGRLRTCRILINTPSSQGAIGDLYNFKLEPSLTLGCGSWGGNSVSENVGVKHLLNYKTVAERRENMLWFRIPPKIYFKRGVTNLALRELQGKKRAFIVTDRFLFNSGVIYNITKVLEEINIDYQIFFDVKPDPTVSTVNEALLLIRTYEPDVIIAFGGGSPIDAAKIIWLMYEHPETDFKDIAMRFMDIRKRICKIPELGKKVQMVAIPTTSGTGSEVTPFAVITDDETHIKYPIADYALTPNMAIIDPDFVDSMPNSLCAASGIDALTHAIEAYVSVLATNFTNSPALEAAKLIFKYLPRSYAAGKDDPVAKEKVHYASTLAGMAFANAFLGLCHSAAHKLGAAFNLSHGIANALVINQIICYNATEHPGKQAVFPQYKFPNAKAKYGQIADELNLGGRNDDEKVDLLINAITQLKKDIQIPLSIKDAGVSEKDFYDKLDKLAEQSFDDQCTGANPVYPLIVDIKNIFIKAYKGEI
ncbi:bifunctional acetaldehyde-CoA/alcohol dehydrogenase [Candidatus Endomicrobiellum trichonymphae]|uniref:Aldehyde-alcohol dehydrogenase n=1 Tax=Endomicrobium trichonymphae TaxID=1408204 RepID=A0A1E5ILZ4_ENDTX|nr:bifunctional acetaldehyde-CoA/alcohol dehydrogenase [Candidatus Endomicrobium trichonymphae]